MKQRQGKRAARAAAAAYGPSTYGDRMAPVYDAWWPRAPEAAVARLAELAGAGRALELGIGTGRVALPLRARGVDVHGIDASRAMVALLRRKPGGKAVPVTIGDFAEVAVAGEFTLVYVVFNTFFALLTQEDQVRCFEGVARRLAPGGCFALEVFVPDPARFDRGQRLTVLQAGLDHVVLDAARHDPLTQRVHAQQVFLEPGGVRFYPLRIRYAWPAELDLMARLAGLRLRDRWAGWEKEPFTASSSLHVSIYEPA